jgi:hypothetical protein
MRNSSGKRGGEGLKVGGLEVGGLEVGGLEVGGYDTLNYPKLILKFAWGSEMIGCERGEV